MKKVPENEKANLLKIVGDFPKEIISRSMESSFDEIELQRKALALKEKNRRNF